MRITAPVFRSLSVMALAAGIITFASGATTAAARRHTRLVKSDPAAHDTLAASPAAIKLWFSEKVELKVSTVRLADGAGKAIKVGELTRDDTKKDAPVVAAIVKPLTAGAYTITWSVASTDGHPAKGTIDFLVKGSR